MLTAAFAIAVLAGAAFLLSGCDTRTPENSGNEESKPESLPTPPPLDETVEIPGDQPASSDGEIEDEELDMDKFEKLLNEIYGNDSEEAKAILKLLNSGSDADKNTAIDTLASLHATNGTKMYVNNTLSTITYTLDEAEVKAQNGNIRELLKQLDPPPTLTSANGTTFTGISASAWQTKSVFGDETGYYGGSANSDYYDSNIVNTALINANITDPDMQRIFFSQITVETGRGRKNKEDDGTGCPTVANGGKMNDRSTWTEDWGGGGSIQITHEGNYIGFADYMNKNYSASDEEIDNIKTGVDYVSDNYTLQTAEYFWNENDINGKLGSGVYSETYTKNDYAGSLVNNGPKSKTSTYASNGKTARQVTYEYEWGGVFD